MTKSPNRPTFWQVITSVMASFFGVQSQANHQRDFTQTSVVPFIVVGIFMVLLLIAGLLMIVDLLL
ncbi:DUF2970 domain-containing protein [Alteromonas flava]|uniref:DUF2970 domain-containing protein n=1 Tax=Alteromonas flava TaxID=2048003 RepID=UPI000C2901F5|nr:DUF2970 domain-containing protein [Alteromonas flava]